MDSQYAQQFAESDGAVEQRDSQPVAIFSTKTVFQCLGRELNPSRYHGKSWSVKSSSLSPKVWR